jgi:16S rRNA (uracil1498-N3)-methyltransferase
LSPTGKNSLYEQSPLRGDLTILIGAEGGLSEAEIGQAMQAGYLDIRLGPRILRTETAAVTVLAACQALWGDLKNVQLSR